MNQDLLEKELARDEGKLLHPYKDQLGNWTIGIGHLLTKDDPLLHVDHITEDQCHALFQQDIKDAIGIARSVCDTYDKLNDCRQRAIVNMAFNMGNRLSGFVRFLGAVDKEDWLEAGRQLEKSHWWKQVGRRAVRIRAMIETGEVSQ